MTRADIIHALAMLPRRESIDILMDADREREAMERAERRQALIADEETASDGAVNRATVISVCCDVFGVTEDELRGNERYKAVWEARACCYVLMLDLLDMLPREVADELGRERSTIVKVAKKARTSDSVKSQRARSLAVDAVAA